VTALTRTDSTATLPDGVIVKRIDYDDHASVVSALQGQDALVITLSTFAPRDQQEKIILAAAEANVPWVLPSEWSPDSQHKGLLEHFPLSHKPAARKQIEELGKSSWVAVTCGFWYEWSLAIPPAFGIDIQKKEATFFDEGETKMTVSTWPQVGRAVAALLSLPIQAEGGHNEDCLERFRNKNVYIGSFTLNQKEMLDSVLRVTGSAMEDWRISKEPAVERLEAAQKAIQEGDREAFVKQMYTRVFYPDDSGDYEKRLGLQNGVLGLPKEDLDEATKVAVERSGKNTYG